MIPTQACKAEANLLETLEGLELSELRRYWELKRSETHAQVTDVQGRLSKAYTFWKNTLHAPELVLYWIQTGLPLLCVPTTYSQGNHQSALQHAGFVSEAINELTANRCATQVSAKPFICSPLSVVVNSEGKSRLVLNLKHLNQFLCKDKFKHEDLRMGLLMFQKDDFLFKI